ncbi:hypothetical protein [Dactylosporangium sp. NPDC049140]|uniref:hypothetical protein n=1 Tax=Dactylosporangium sp. NPDC049140 TaxID=3155647 RepID=UPI0033C76D35
MSALVSGSALGTWRVIRRYAVPRSMIEEATAARERGDWRGACAAAGVAVAARPEDLAPYADDLAHLAPDLVRWHLPRYPPSGETTLEPRTTVVLARRGETFLGIATPRVARSTQRLSLVVAPSFPDQRLDWRAARHLWDVREADRLIARTCGPRTRQMLALHDAGWARAAWALAGVDVPEPPGGFPLLDADPDILVAAARSARAPSSLVTLRSQELRLHVVNGGPPRAEWVTGHDRSPGRLPMPAYLRPPDLHLVRLGLLSPADLHPLVGPLLAPFAAAVPAASDEDPAVRVRCGGAWHALGWSGGRMRLPHTAQERRREEALRALGGEVHGCFAAERAWGDRAARLPRRLERQRRDLLLRMQHGDLAGVEAVLDAGVDPRVRDPHGRTLLHLLPCVDWRPGWERLLERLLAGGLDVDDHDHAGLTPLYAAVHDGGSPVLVRALIAAGATVDDLVVEAWDRYRRDDVPELPA